MTHQSGLHPSIVLSVYIEPLIRGRRVAILGDATVGLGEELSARGARLVHAYDPDATRVAEALAKASTSRPHQVAHAVLADDLGVRDGAFDVVVVPDLSVFADPADLLRRARRLVSPTGAAVFVAPNLGAEGRRLVPTGAGARRGPGYYELFDLVSLQFSKVRMIGQAPFVGYTVADFAPSGEPEVSVDTSLLASSEEPEHFIAIGSDRPVTLDAFTVVELPWSEVSDAMGAAETAPRSPTMPPKGDADPRLALATAELEKLRDQKAEEAREAEARSAKWASLSARAGELEAELERQGARLKETEARAGDSHVRAERLTHQIRDMEEELVKQRDRGTRLSKQLDDEKKGRTKAEVELGMLRGRPEIAGGKDRIDALTAEVEAARVRIGELELEHQVTKRRGDTPHVPPPIVLPPPSIPDPKLLHRLNELEQAVNAALREAAEAASQRDQALDRARKAEARIERVTDIEAALETARREKAELIEHAGVLETRGMEAEKRLDSMERQLVEAERRSTALATERDAAAQRAASAAREAGEVMSPRVAKAERDAAEAERRRAEIEKRAAESERRAAEIEKRAATTANAASELTAMRDRLAAAEQAAAVRDAAIVALTGELEKTKNTLSAAREEAASGTGEEMEAELSRLEEALKERGHVIAALKREMRESERVGLELLEELTATKAESNGVHEAPEERGAASAVAVNVPVIAPSAGAGAMEAAELRTRLDSLAASAARAEADLTAARWRIAQLEREATEMPGRERPARAVEIELEEALAAARNELASLRRALSGTAG